MERNRRFMAAVACATLLCGCATVFVWKSAGVDKRSELLGYGAPIYSSLERPVKHFIHDLPQEADAEQYGDGDPHEDRVLRRMRRLRAEQAKLEDQKQAIIDRLTKEKDAAELEVARTAVDSHRLRLAGMGGEAGDEASSVGRAAKKEREGYEFAKRAFENKIAHHEKWLQYWNHLKDVREKRLKELDDLLRTGPGAVHTEMSPEETEKRQTEHCNTVRKMLEELQGEAETVEDEKERVPLLEHIESIKKVVSKCGKATGRVKPDAAQDFLTKQDFIDYAGNLMAHAPTGPNGERLGPISYDQWLNKKAAPWWEGAWNIERLGGHAVGRTKAAKQPWWKGRWNVRGQGIRK
eukprot:2541438-Rhodomonas_salina.1